MRLHHLFQEGTNLTYEFRKLKPRTLLSAVSVIVLMKISSMSESKRIRLEIKYDFRKLEK